MSHFKVTIFRPAASPYFKAKWFDPETGLRKVKSTKTKLRREAERFAARLEKELREGTFYEPSKTRWKEFRSRYETEAVPGFAEKTAVKIKTVFNTIESTINPTLLSQVKTNALSKLVKHLREKKRSEATIESYLRYTQAILNWAHDRQLIAVVPKMPKLKRVKNAKMMKGRPITTEEFERMLKKVEVVVTNKRKDSWEYLLRGLWLSGLRLNEALELWWDRDDKMNVDLSGKFPMLHIKAETEKGFQDRQLPITPDFAEFLQATPESERTGRVFQPKPGRVYGDRMRLDSVSSVICTIGEKAGIVVHHDEEKGRTKYASAHDLRRAFGERWSKKLMPAVLQQLMRHESIDTTMRYYVGRNAESVAEEIWRQAAQIGHKTGHGAPKGEQKPQKEKAQAPKS